MLATVFFAHGWSPTTINSVVPGGWSIAVEMNFYLLVPSLFRWLTSLRRCVWFFVACVAGQAVVNAAMRPVFLRVLSADEQYLADLMHTLWLPTQLPVFAAGFVLYYALAPVLARRTGQTRQTDWPSPGLWLVLAAVVLAQLRLGPHSMFWGSLFAILAAGLALYSPSLLVNAYTRYLGTISYSGYLVHFVVLDLAERVIQHFTALTRSPLLHLAALYAVVVFGTVLLAIVMNRLVEEPARGVGRSLIAELERRYRKREGRVPMAV